MSKRSRLTRILWLFGTILPLHAQTGTPLQSEVRLLNRQASLNPQKVLLERRQKIVEQLIRTDPDALQSVLLSNADRDRITRSFPEASSLLEHAIEWDGVLELRVEDDFEQGRSRTEWRIRTEEGRFEMFFGKGGEPSEHTPGSPIRLTGTNSGSSVAVGQLSVRVPVLPQPGAPASGTQVCSTTGPQKIAVLKFTFPGATSYPAGLNDSFFQQTWFGASGASLNTYWQQTSYGKTSATGQIFGPFALSQGYTCAQSDAFATAAFQAASASVNLTQFTRFALLFPVPNCTFTGLATLGCETLPNSRQIGSVAWVPLYSADQATSELAVLAHEHGHNLGLDHASSVDYGTNPIGALDNPGTVAEYGDPFSAMAFGTAAYASEQSSLMLGWLQPSDYQEVQASGTFTVAPYENSTGIRAMRVLRDRATSAWLWIEYRQAGGALVHYENPNLDPRRTFLADFNPTATPNNFKTAALTVGQTWTDPVSPLRLTVNSALPSGLSISVNYDTPCATSVLSPALLGSAGGAGTIAVTAPNACAWTASTATPWIALGSPASGSGNGTVPFTAAANAGTSQRHGYVTVARQSLPVVQSGSGALIQVASPISGAGASAHVSMNFSSSKGAADIHHATVDIFGVPGCDVYVDAPGRAFYLLSDSGQYLGPLTSGAAGNSIANSQCTVVGSGSAMATSGNLLQVDLQLNFSPTFAGTRRVSASVTDSISTNGPFPFGSWTVPAFSVQMPVPNVVSQTQGAATIAIVTASLTVGTVTLAASTTVASGRVIRESPLPGTLVPAGSPVQLVISAGPPLPPSLYLDEPLAGATIFGTVPVSGWAIDNRTAAGTPIGSVQILVDGAAVGKATYGSPRADVCSTYPGRPNCPNVGFTYTLDATKLTTGPHTLRVIATDTDGPANSASIDVGITVVPVPVQPTVYLDAPLAGATLSGLANVSGWAIDNRYAPGSAIAAVQVFVDGIAIGNATYGSARADVCSAYPGRPNCPNVGFRYVLDTTKFAPGTHTIRAIAVDSDPTPSTGLFEVNVAIAVPAAPPAVYLDTPAPGAFISGTINVSGWAIDNRSAIGTAIGSVQVLVDGVATGTAVYGSARADVCAAYPGRANCPNVGFNFALDTTRIPAGPHTLRVIASDTDPTPDSGFADVAFTVATPAGPPAVYIDAPLSGTAISGTVTVRGWALDNRSAAGSAIGLVQVMVDGITVGNATYGTPRGDVCAAFPGRPGCPNVGFTYALDTRVLAPGPHKLRVVATDTDLAPDTGFFEIDIVVGSSGVPPSLYVDSPIAGATITGTVTVSGWALDNRTGIGTAIGSVSVLVDGGPAGNAVYGGARPDVCGAYPGRPDCPNVGFSYALNTAALATGAHTIRVVAVDTDATPASAFIEVPVTVLH